MRLQMSTTEVAGVRKQAEEGYVSLSGVRTLLAVNAGILETLRIALAAMEDWHNLGEGSRHNIRHAVRDAIARAEGR
jgi:hypothetical protein